MLEMKLTAIRADEAPLIAEWRQDGLTRRWLPLRYPEDAEQRYRHIASLPVRETLAFMIRVDSEPVGVITLADVRYEDRRAMVGYFISPHCRSRGYATAALKHMVKYAFDELNLRRLQAHVVDGNAPSAFVLNKAGFRHEGTLREDYYLDGAYRHVYVYGILKDD